MRPTTAIQLLTGTHHAITPNSNPKLTGAHLPYLLPITEPAMVAVVQVPVLVLHLDTTNIHPIAIPIILKDHPPEKTPHSTQTLPSTSQNASIQRVVDFPKVARTHLLKDWRII
jgi:hypothetical protein